MSIEDLSLNINKRFDFVDKRFDSVDKRLGSVDKRFDSVDKRLSSVDKRLNGIQKEINFLASSSAREFKDISHRFDLLEISVAGIKKVIINGRFDKRMEQLERDMDKVKQALAL